MKRVARMSGARGSSVVPETTAIQAGGVGGALARRLGRRSDALAQRRKEATVVELGVEEVLIPLLKSARRNYSRHRDGPYLHVSDLLGKCVRKFALYERLGVKPAPVALTESDGLTFAQGEAIHDYLKERTRIASPEKMWGKWKCKCGTLHVSEPCTHDKVPKTLCLNCRHGMVFYEEVSMRSDSLMVVGNPDLLLLLPEIDAFHVNELKSIAADQYKELVRPKPEHIIQVLFYWRIMRELGYRLTDKVSILYASKGYIFKGSPYVEFCFEAAPLLSRLRDFEEDAIALVDSRKPGGKLPKRTRCASQTSPDAKKCDMCAACFAES